MIDVKSLFNVKSPILLEGETGTGKSIIAKKIHDGSQKAVKKFIHLNLATIREDLIESELFGYFKGAFTSANSNRVGYFQEVGDGTLFLDEISELSLDAQKKLLLVLEERKFIPIGSCYEKKFFGRIISATNRNLRKMMMEGKFRKDLYYRLNVFYYEIPPLREDRNRLNFLSRFYFDHYKKELEKINLRMDDEVKTFIDHYSWPGNIRELKNFMEYIVNLSQNVVYLSNIPPWIDRNETNIDLEKNEISMDFNVAKSKFEKKFFTHALTQFDGKVNLTAKKINVSKTTLIAKTKKYQINPLKIKADATQSFMG